MSERNILSRRENSSRQPAPGTSCWMTIPGSTKDCGSRTCKPNSVRLNAAGRPFLWATHYCGAQATYPEVVAHRAGTRPWPKPKLGQEIPPYLVLLRVGFALPAALLPRRCALTAPFHPYRNLAAPAVCFLWHFPSNDPGLKAGPSRTLSGTLPCGVRTFLCLCGTPARQKRARRGPGATATVRPSCQHSDYSAGG